MEVNMMSMYDDFNNPYDDDWDEDGYVWNEEENNWYSYDAFDYE